MGGVVAHTGLRGLVPIASRQAVFLDQLKRSEVSSCIYRIRHRLLCTGPCASVPAICTRSPPPGRSMAEFVSTWPLQPTAEGSTKADDVKEGSGALWPIGAFSHAW